MRPKGTLYIVSAPSGAGKTSLVQALVDSTPRIEKAIGYTTRKKREGETEGIDYHFISQAKFNRMRAQNDFLESAQVFGNDYGTSRSDTETYLNRGIDLILVIDVQGAAQVRGKMSTVSIFVLPPSREELKQRLLRRKQDDPHTIEKRLQEADREMARAGEYDYTIVNDDFDTALAELKAIVQHQRQTQ